MFQANLKLLRKLKRMTQKQMAEALGLSPQRYNHYETGRSEPDHETLKGISDYFGIPMDSLFYGLNISDIPNIVNKSDTISDIAILDYSIDKAIDELEAIFRKTINDILNTQNKMLDSLFTADHSLSYDISSNTNKTQQYNEVGSYEKIVSLSSDEEYLLRLYRSFPDKIKGKAELFFEQLANISYNVFSSQT